MMRLLADENFPGPVIASLVEEGHDIVAVARHHAGLEDSAVLALAHEEKRWLLTFDTDFGDLVFLRHRPAPPVILLFRIYPILVADVIAAARRALDEVTEGHFAVVGRESTRVRPFRSNHARE